MESYIAQAQALWNCLSSHLPGLEAYSNLVGKGLASIGLASVGYRSLMSLGPTPGSRFAKLVDLVGAFALNKK